MEKGSKNDLLVSFLDSPLEVLCSPLAQLINDEYGNSYFFENPDVDKVVITFEE